MLNALGPLQVIVAGEPVVVSPAQRRVLSILLVEADRDVSTEQLIELMWPVGPPRTARTALHVHLSGLRKHSVPFDSTATGYRLSLDGMTHDRVEFERLVAAAHDDRADHRWTEAYRGATGARSLWRGDPFPDLADSPCGAVISSRLREMALHAAEIEVDALLALGRNSVAVQRLQELIDHSPLHDGLRHRLMLALYRSGRQVEALREFQAYRTLLGETMGIEPGVDVRRLEEQILLHDPTLGAPSGPPTPHNLPSVVTSFVGREHDLREVTAALDETGLVTVTGAPGLGKTRLATEVGWNVLERFPGGVWVAELGGARTARDVVATIGAVTIAGEQVDSVETLASALRSRPILLILDNCEHVLEPVRRFLVAWGSGPRAGSVLLTSRQPMSAPCEWVHRLEPLTSKVEGSVALLVDRARAVDRSFQVNRDNVAGMLGLCERLGGIPLAIELVARFVPAFGVSDTSRLLDQIRGDDGLVAAFDWSTALVPEADRTLLYDLAVFESSFTLRRAHDVCGCGDEMATAGSISRLVDASLLTLDASGPAPRYRMLQPFRELAWMRSPSARRQLLEARHADAIAAAATDLRTATLDQRQADAFVTLDAEIADHRKALARFRDARQWGPMTTILEALSRYWYARFLGWEARAWLEELPADELEHRDRVRVHRVAGFLAWAIHDYDGADTHYSALLDLGRVYGDRLVEADALFGRGLIHQKRRFLDGATMLEQAASLYAEVGGHALELGQCLMFRGLDEAYTGDVDVAQPILERASALLEDVGHLRQVSKSQRWLAHCAWRRGDEAAARRHADRSEQLARTLGDQIALSGALVEQATIAITWDNAASAAGHLLEALGPIPADDEVDACQVLIPVARLALRTGDAQVVATVLTYIDDVYDRHGWLPLDGIQGAVSLRAAAEGVRVERVDVRRVVERFLIKQAG